MELSLEFRQRLFTQILATHGEARDSGKNAYYINVDLPIPNGRNVYSKAARRLNYVVQAPVTA